MECIPSLILAALLPTLASAQSDTETWSKTQKDIQTWQADASKGSEPSPAPVLRVVYFHGNDMDPLPGYKERLTRVMDDIRDFYRDGMRMHGFVSNGLALEKDADQKLVLHLVTGQHEAKHYTYDSGAEAKAEIRKALARKIDLDRDFVLVLYGQCWKMEDGRWGFYSPYYGDTSSSQRRGFCHAADAPFLDTKLLTDTKNRVLYWEHYGDRDQSLALFNSFYIGGIAHELGHGLGLRHNRQSPTETLRYGNSLMGNGNHTYRDELWKPKSRGSFLALADAARLASHPLFTGSSAGRFEESEAAFTDLKVTKDGQKLSLTANIEPTIPAYAVIAYVDPASRPGDYDARTYTVPVAADGTFALTNMPIPEGKTNLLIFSCHMNGEVTRIASDIPRSALGIINVEGITQNLIGSYLSAAEQAVAIKSPEAAKKVAQAKRYFQKGSDDEKARIALLESWVAEPTPLIDLANTDTKTCYLSDANWNKAESGWAGTPRDKWGAEAKYGQGLFLDIAGKLHTKGLPAHCPALHEFRTAGKWKQFTAIVGIRDGAGASSRAVFIVEADGKEIYRSEPMAIGKSANVDLDISGVETLTLRTESGTKSNHTCWAVWGSPLVKK